MLEPGIRALGYHTLLGGSVLHKGKSNKDIDLFFSPLATHQSNPLRIKMHLYSVFGDALQEHGEGDAEYGNRMWHWKVQGFHMLGNRRIDIFIQ